MGRVRRRLGGACSLFTLTLPAYVFPSARDTGPIGKLAVSDKLISRVVACLVLDICGEVLCQGRDSRVGGQARRGCSVGGGVSTARLLTVLMGECSEMVDEKAAVEKARVGWENGHGLAGGSTRLGRLRDSDAPFTLPTVRGLRGGALNRASGRC